MKCPLCSSSQLSLWVALPEGQRYSECGLCGLVSLEKSHFLSQEEERSRYLTHENHVENPSYLSYLWRTAEPVVKLLAAGAKGLDYGCGPTEGMKALLSSHGFTVESYDPFFFPRSDLLKFRYDFLLCSEAAEHFFEPGLEFAKMNSLLKEGGVLGVSSQICVSREHFPHWYYRKDPTHVAFYQEKTVHWLARHFAWELKRLKSPLWVFQKPSGGGRNFT